MLRSAQLGRLRLALRQLPALATRRRAVLWASAWLPAVDSPPYSAGFAADGSQLQAVHPITSPAARPPCANLPASLYPTTCSSIDCWHVISS